jgi:hypothetical protein
MCEPIVGNAYNYLTGIAEFESVYTQIYILLFN